MRASCLLALFCAGCLVQFDRYQVLSANLVDDDGDGVSEHDGDCDDANPLIFPGASDGCDGLDNDCDGAEDEDPDRAVYLDSDGDGFGDALHSLASCADRAGYVAQAGDCDVADENVSPAAPELCNDRDDNCDGDVDEDVKATWYRDSDGDLFGEAGFTMDACDRPGGFADRDGDCDDTDADTAPDVEEVCGDGIDNDCDGEDTACRWPASFAADATFVGTAGEGVGAALALTPFDESAGADLLVGTAAGGTVYVRSGGEWSGGALGAAGATLTGAGAFGRSVVACDVDGVDEPQILVAAYDADGFGEIYQYAGNVSGAGATALESQGSFLEADGFGAALACGNVDDQGGDDLVVGAPLTHDEAGSSVGAIHVVMGASNTAWVGGDERSGQVWRWAHGDEADGAVGASVATGDIDGDGYDDVAAGATGAPGEDEASGAGTVWLVPGPFAEDEDLRDIGYALDAPIANAGAGPVSLGDLDGDGYDDVVVGAPGVGSAYVVTKVTLNPWPTSDDKTFNLSGATVTLAAAQPRTGFGSSVLVLPADDDGGGGGIAVGAPADGGAGAVYIWQGIELVGAYDTSMAQGRWQAEEAGGAFGTAIAAGDVDDDGLVDLVIGAPGQGSGAGAVHTVFGVAP